MTTKLIERLILYIIITIFAVDGDPKAIFKETVSGWNRARIGLIWIKHFFMKY